MSDAIFESVEDMLARILPPPGFEEYLVVESSGVLVWMKPEDVGPEDQICFYDGDCRDVLKPEIRV